MTFSLSPFLQFSIVFIIILVAAKLGGYASTRLGQPSILGELLAGILLGPSLLNITRIPLFQDSTQVEQVLQDLGQMGVLLLMFLAGMELHLGELVKNARTSLRIALFGVIFSILLIGIVGFSRNQNISSAFFLGLCLAATSISISAQTLIELKMLRSKVGLGLLGAAVADDILVLILFSVFTALHDGQNGWVSLVGILVRVVLFLTITIGFGLFLLPRLTRWVQERQMNYGAITFAIVILLGFGLLAELVGNLSAILGSFLAGLMYSRLEENSNIQPGLRTLTYTVFAPIFFIGIGLQLDLHLIQPGVFIVLLGLTASTVLGKLGGAGLGARLSSFSWKDSFQLGIGMIPRGEVTLIVASVGVNQGMLDSSLFPAVIGTVIITTLITPFLLRFSYSIKESASMDKEKKEKTE